MVDRGPFAGPGKYDDEATWVRKQTGGDLVVVLVAGGIKGSGFSLQLALPSLDTEEAARTFVATAISLRSAADDMDRAALRATGGKGARARARLLVSAAVASLQVLQLGLRGVLGSFGAEEMLALGEADGLMTRAAEALQRSLERRMPPAKGSA